MRCTHAQFSLVTSVFKVTLLVQRELNELSFFFLFFFKGLLGEAGM